MATRQNMPSAFRSSPEVHKCELFFLKLGSWNVRTLNETQLDMSLRGRGHHLVGELGRYDIDVCCLSETKWPGSGLTQIGEWQVAFSGSTVGLKKHGVGIAMSPRLKGCLLQTDNVSDRVMTAVFRMGSVKLHLVSVYAPTDDKSEEEKEQFYESVQICIDRVPSRDKVIIAGDFNAQLGGQDRHAWAGALGKFCLGNRATDNGTRLLSFCALNQLAVRNTFFQQKDIHLATWVGPSGLLANQIDHVLVRRQDAKHISNCRVFRGSDFESDHKLVRAQCKFSGRFQKVVKPPPRINVQLLESRGVKRAFDSQIQQAWNDAKSLGPQVQWEHFKCALQAAQRSLLTQPQAEQWRHTWLSDNTQQLIAQKKLAWETYVKEKKKIKAPIGHDGKKNKPSPKQKRNTGGPQGGVSTSPCEKMKDDESGACSLASEGLAQPAPHVGPPGTSRAHGDILRLSGGRSGAQHACNGPGAVPPLSQPRVALAWERYRAANNSARKAVQWDKRKHWVEEAAKLEELFKKGNIREAYKQNHLKTSDGKVQSMPEQMKKGDGELVKGVRENCQLKRDYFSELLNVDKGGAPDVSCIPQQPIADLNVSPPTLEETIQVIEQLKTQSWRDLLNSGRDLEIGRYGC